MRESTKEAGVLSLWSWHEPGWDLTKGRVDHRRSHYYKHTPGVPESYKQLSKQLIKRFKLEPKQADQFVWCYTEVNAVNLCPGTIKRVEWQLEVSEDLILAKVCDVAWHCIMCRNGGDNSIGTPPKKFNQLWGKIEHSSRLESGYFNKEFFRFWYAKTDEELWGALFLDKVCGECTTVLLRHPVDGGWIKNYSSCILKNSAPEPH